MKVIRIIGLICVISTEWNFVLQRFWKSLIDCIRTVFSTEEKFWNIICTSVNLNAFSFVTEEEKKDKLQKEFRNSLINRLLLFVSDPHWNFRGSDEINHTRFCKHFCALVCV